MEDELDNATEEQLDTWLIKHGYDPGLVGKLTKTFVETIFENLRLRAALETIVARKPVALEDGREWRMEWQDCARIAKEALGAVGNEWRK